MYCPNPHSELYKELMIINKNDKDLVYYAYHEIEKLQEMGLISSKRYKMPDGTMRYTINKTITEKSLAESYKGENGFTIDLSKKQKLDNYIKQFNISFLNTEISKSGKAIFVNITPVKNHVIKDIRNEDERKLEQGYKQNKKEGNWDVNSDGDIVHPDDMYREDNNFKQFNNQLFNFLKGLNIHIIENGDKLLNNQEFEKNPLSAFDVLQKLLILKENISNKDVALQTANIIYTFLGKKSKLSIELWNSIQKWSKYKDIYNKFANSNKQDELLDDNEELYPGFNKFAHKQAIIHLIAESIINNYGKNINVYKNENPDINKEYFEKLGYKDIYEKNLIKNLLNKIWNFINEYILGNKVIKSLSRKELNDKVLDIVDDVFKQDYSKFIRDIYEKNGELYKSDGSKLELKDYDKTLNNDVYIKEVIEKLIYSDYLGYKLSGSQVLRKYGKLYRDVNENLHDIDGIITLEQFRKEPHNVEFSKWLKTRGLYLMRSGKQKKFQQEIMKFLNEQTWLNNIKIMFPSFEFENIFIGKDHKNAESVTITGSIEHKTELNDDGTKKRIILDFFLRTSEGKYVEIFDNYWKDWKQIFEAKLNMGRAKDLTDLIYFDPFIQDKYHFLNKGYRYFTFNDDVSETNQKENKTQLNSKIKNFLSKIGVNTINVEQILDKNGNPLSAIAVAKMLDRIIQVVENKADITTLPEEAAHFFVELLKDNQLLNKMLGDIVNYPEYNEVKNSEFYQKQYKGDETLIRKEAIGKLIGRIIAKQETSEQATSWWGRVWNKIKSIFNGKSSLFEEIASDIRKGDNSKLDVSKTLKNEFYQETNNSKERKEVSAIEQTYYRRINRLSKELAIKNISETKKQSLENELNITKALLAKHNIKSTQREADLEFGRRNLEIVNRKIDILTKDFNSPTLSEDMEYIENMLDVFDTDDLSELKTPVSELRNKLKSVKTKFIEKITGHSIEEINKDKKDIGTWKGGTGSLMDIPNILARTIGKLINSAQNKIERKSKAIHKEIIDKIKDIEKSSGRKINDVFKEIIFVSKDGKKSLLDEGYINAKNISNEAKEFYYFYKSKMRELIALSPTMIHTNSETGETEVFNLDDSFIPNIPVKKSLNSKLKETKNPLRLSGLIKTRKIGDFTRDEEEKLDIIPTDFIKGLKGDEKSDDLGEALYLFATSIYNHDEMSKVLPTARLLQREIYNTKYIQGSNPNATKTEEKSNIYKIVEGYIKIQVKGEYKADEGKIGYNQRNVNGEIVEDYIDVVGALDKLIRFNSLNKIGLAPIGALANWAYGLVSDFVEAIGGEYFNLREFKTASGIFYKQTFDKDSILNKELLSKYNILQEMTDYELKDSIKSGVSKLSKERLMELLYLPQKSGEKAVQSTPLLAMMLRDEYITKDGKLTDKWNELSEEARETFVRKVTFVNNRMHGRYNPKESAIWSQQILYRLVSQFKKYIVTGIETRFDKKHYSERAGKDIEGRYITLVHKIFSKDILYNIYAPLFSAKAVIESGKFTEHEVANMRKNLTEIILMTASMILLGLGSGDKEEAKRLRKNRAYKAYLLTLNRVSGDIEFFFNPKNITNLANHPAAATKMIDDLFQVSRDVLTPEYVLKGGNAKGENRLLKDVTDVLPAKNLIQDPIKIFNKNILDESRN